MAYLTTGSNTPSTDPTNLQVTMQHKSGTALIWCDNANEIIHLSIRLKQTERAHGSFQNPCNLLLLTKEKKKGNTMSTGIPLFVQTKEEIDIWCKHQANPHHRN